MRYYGEIYKIGTNADVTTKIFDTADTSDDASISAGKIKQLLDGVGSASFVLPRVNSYSKTLASGDYIQIHRVTSTDSTFFAGRVKNIEKDVYGNATVSMSECSEILRDYYGTFNTGGASPFSSLVALILNYVNNTYGDNMWWTGICGTDITRMFSVNLTENSTALDALEAALEIGDANSASGKYHYWVKRYTSSKGYYRSGYSFNYDTENNMAVSSQSLELGKNISDIKISADIPEATIIRASGKDSDGNELKFVDYEPTKHVTQYNLVACAAYTDNSVKIMKAVDFGEDFDADPLAEGGLRDTAQQYVDTLCSVGDSYEIEGVDMSAFDDDVAPFEIGQRVRVISTVHDLDVTVPISELCIDLCNPLNTTISVGATRPRITR